MKRQLLLLQCLIVGAAAAWAQGPNNSGTYYQSANGAKGASLKTALFQIIKNPDVVSYGGLLNAYKQTDVRPDGYLRDWYSNITNYVPGSGSGNYKKEGDVYNREHSIPQNWFGSSSPMKSDIVHVIPTDGYVNNRRSSNPYGEVSTPTYQSANNYSKLGPSKTSGYTGTVFEPNDEVKGDIARIYFYMATAYEDKILSWTNGTGSQVIGGSKHQPYKQWVLDMMLRWAKLDPVDDVERARNQACYDVQKNRNPFVDYPGLEDYIWGDKQQVAFSYNNYGGDVTPTPDPQPDPDPKPDPDPDQQPAAGTILLNNTFFGCDWTGTRPSNGAVQLSGSQQGIKVVYAKGDSGQNMYCNDTQIRLYQKNTLTFSVSSGQMQKIAFETDNNPTKPMYATTGTVSDYVWTGKAQEVTFTVADGSGHVRLKSATVSLAGSDVSTGIGNIEHSTLNIEHSAFNIGHSAYDLQGRRMTKSILSKGIYVVNGKKIVVR